MPPDEYPAESGAIDDNLPQAEECYDFPTMVDVAGPSRYDKTDKITDDSSSNDVNVVFDRAPIPMEEDPSSSSPPNNHPIASSESKVLKHSRLEKAILAIKKQQLEYPTKFSGSVVTQLKRKLRANKSEAVKYINECFGSMLDDEGFLKWLGNTLDYKPCRLKQLLQQNKFNKRNSLSPSTYQTICDYWLANSITSNESDYNITKITKMSFLEQYKNISDTNLMEKEIKLKNGSKIIFTAPRKIYTESVRNLHQKYNEMHTPISLSVFFNMTPFYCVRPSEREKQSCLV